MKPGPDPGQRFILPDLKNTPRRLDPVTGAPPGNERARQRRVEKVDRHSVLDDVPIGVSQTPLCRR
jgi:hypothetical protein